MPAIALAAIRADGPRVIHFLHNTQALFVFSPQPAVPTSSRVCRNGSIPADARSVHTIPDVYILPENACTRNSDIQGLSVPSPVPSHLRLGQASTSPAEILLRVAFPRPTFGYLLPGRLGSPHRRRGAADEAVEPVVVGPRRTFGTYRKWPWTSPGWRAWAERGFRPARMPRPLASLMALLLALCRTSAAMRGGSRGRVSRCHSEGRLGDPKNLATILAVSLFPRRDPSLFAQGDSLGWRSTKARWVSGPTAHGRRHRPVSAASA